MTSRSGDSLELEVELPFETGAPLEAVRAAAAGRPWLALGDGAAQQRHVAIVAGRCWTSCRRRGLRHVEVVEHGAGAACPR